jgi:hypothetical protein
MNTRLLTKVRTHFNCDLVSREQNRSNQRKWVRAVRMLGDRWLLAGSVPKLPVLTDAVPEYLMEKS